MEQPRSVLRHSAGDGVVERFDADGWLTLSPRGYSGDEMFAAGVSSIATQDVTNITPVNDPPVAQNGTANTFLGTLVIGTLVAIDIDSAPLSYAIVTNGTNRHGDRH